MKKECSRSVPFAQHMRAEYCASDRFKLEGDSSGGLRGWMVLCSDAAFTSKRKNTDYLLKPRKFDFDIYLSVMSQVVLLQGRFQEADYLVL